MNIILFPEFVLALGSFIINDLIAVARNGGLGST